MLVSHRKAMSLFKSIAAFGGTTIISRVTGFVRDMLLATVLGAGAVSDAFFVGFKLPNLFRSLFAEGAFNSAFVPLAAAKFQKDREKAIKFSSDTLSALVFFLAIFIILFEIFMPYVMFAIAPGFVDNPEKMEMATKLARIMFPFLLFVSVVSFQSGVLNSVGKFATAAAAPIILNLVMIIAIFIPISIDRAETIAYSVTFAGILEVLWLVYFLKKENIHIRFSLQIFSILKKKDIKTLFKRMGPGIMGSGIYQINVVVSTIISSLIGTGAISWLYYAGRIQQLPLGIVGAAIGVALLPILSKHLENNETNEAFKTQNKAIEYGAILSIPAMIALIVLAEPITNILFERGKFTPEDTKMTYKAIIAFALSLPFFVAVKALSQSFFARGDTKTPVKYGFISFIVNIVLSFALMYPFGHVGIALASTFSAIVSCYQYYFGLKKRGFWHLEPLLKKQILKIIFCSITMGAVIKITEIALNLHLTNWLAKPLLAKLFIFGALCILGLATFGFMAKITKVIDLKTLRNVLLKRGKKNAR